MELTIKLRRDSAQNWTTINPVLHEGEAGVELDTKKMKLGDGVTVWTSLPYVNVIPNADITGATHTKITYDSKGLVTGGEDLTANDIPSLTLSKISDVTASANEVNVLDGITSTTTELNQIHDSNIVTSDLTKLHNITSTASEINILDGATLTTTELNYVDGVTSAIQTQINGKVSKSGDTLTQAEWGDSLTTHTIDASLHDTELDEVVGTTSLGWKADPTDSDSVVEHLVTLPMADIEGGVKYVYTDVFGSLTFVDANGTKTKYTKGKIVNTTTSGGTSFQVNYSLPSKTTDSTLATTSDIGNATITFKANGSTIVGQSFTTNATSDVEIDLGNTGLVDDVKVGTTSVVTNKIANLGTMAGESKDNYLPLTGGTLSGDLAVNNSFLVGKKSGYVRVAYVDMPAGSYVNSGYYGNLDSEIMLVGSAQASSNIIQFAGGITNTAAAIALNGGMTQDTTTRFGNRYVTNTSRLQVGQKVTITTNKSTYTMVDDNGSVLYSGTFSIPSEFTTATPILVGKADGSSNAVAKRIYAFVASENGVQKVALYPAKRVLDGVVGLYDIVSNTFLTNVGTGTFTAGAEIQDEISFPTEYIVGNSVTDALTFSDNGVEIKKEYNKDDNSYNVANTKFVKDNLSSKYDKAGGVVYGDIYGNQEIHSHDVLSVGIKNDGTVVSGVTIYDKVQHTSFATASTPTSYAGPRIATGLSCKTTTKVILSYKPLVTQYPIAASARMLFLNDNQRILWEYGDGEVQTIVLQSEYNDSDIITIGGATESYELYSVVILEGTKCVAHFVPAVQGTTKGMYDLQRKTFYGWAYSNSSATNVSYGTEVNPVGSYSIGTVSDVGLNFMTNGENRVLIGNDGIVKLNQEVSSTATGKEVVTAEWVTQQGYLTEHQDISGLATKEELSDGLDGKQDVISDLSAIRSGAELGSTAVQPNQLSTVATSGSYNDLTNKPTIPTKTSELTNDSGFITISALVGYATQEWVQGLGYITGINSADVTTALGYTPLKQEDLSTYAQKSEIPTQTSQLTNNSDFTTKAYVDGLVGDIETALNNINSGS